VVGLGGAVALLLEVAQHVGQGRLVALKTARGGQRLLAEILETVAADLRASPIHRHLRRPT
jgi:hypothetical protein